MALSEETIGAVSAANAAIDDIVCDLRQVGDGVVTSFVGIFQNTTAVILFGDTEVYKTAPQALIDAGGRLEKFFTP